VSFPEYGPRSFKPPPGGAVVFPCALLHAVSPVTRGRRYAFLPFLYDEEAAKLREANSQFLAEGGGVYKANQPAAKAAGATSSEMPDVTPSARNGDAGTEAPTRRAPRTTN